ncbi:hypothetical protein FF2_035491 [Malus domestica]
MYDGRFSHEYSCYAEADDKTAIKAFTAYNHASAEAKTYQGKPPTATPYQQVGGGSQIQPNEKTSTFQTAAVPPSALLNTSPSQQTYQP